MTLDEAILELERASLALAERVGRLERFRLPAQEQQAAASWYDLAPGSSPAPNATFTGVVKGCGGFGLPSATVTLLNAATSATVWTGTTDSSGNYSGSIATASGVVVKISVTPGDPQASRFVSGLTGSSFTVAPGSNTAPAVTIAPAGGYTCSSLLYYPLANTLHLTDSVNGTLTLTNSGSGWKASATLSFPGCPAHGCPAATVVFKYTFNGTSLGWTYQYVPTSGNCPRFGAGVADYPDGSRPVTLTGSAPFGGAAALGAGNGSFWYCGAAVSWVLSE